MIKKLILALLLLSCIYAQTAIAPSLGDGSEVNPYQITNWQNLYWISQNSGKWDKHYIQTENITFPEDIINWNGGAGWTPIGTLATKFEGKYDGDGHTISGIYINTDADNVGLFGYTYVAQIKNLAILDIDITGGQCVGGLTGRNLSNGGDHYDKWGSIYNCYTSGRVIGSQGVGGLVGMNMDDVSNSFSCCSVTGNQYVGGLVGYFYKSSLKKCYSCGEVKGSQDVGGLVGLGEYGFFFIRGEVSQCFWDVETSNKTTSSGGTGKTTTEMKTLTTFTNSDWDFVCIWGLNDTINQGYPHLFFQSPKPRVETTSISKMSSDSIIINIDYYYSGTTTQNYIGICWAANTLPEIGDNVSELLFVEDLGKYQISIYGLDLNTEYYARAVLLNNQDTIYGNSLKFVTSPISPASPSIGEGSASNPYQIATLENLYWIIAPDIVISLPNQVTRCSYYYNQVADIDASPTSTWNPDELNTCSGWNPIDFYGTYDGQNHAIRNLYIYRPNSSRVGLFSRTRDNARIKNLILESVNITGDYYVGALVGYNRAYVNNCRSTGRVIGNIYVGGLIGYNQDHDISQCYSNSDVIANENVGGLVGDCFDNTISQSYSSGSVTGERTIGGLVGNLYETTCINCYSSAKVTATKSGVGGLIGDTWQGSITNCYSFGKVTGPWDDGGLIGEMSTTNISNCFWDIETSNQTSSSGGVGKTTEEMKTLSTFTDASWDFVNIWGINADINSGHPYLLWSYGLDISLSITDNKIPNKYVIAQNYPNPFNPTTTINYDLPESQNIKLQVFDITGRLVETLYNGYKEAGHWDVTWNASDQSSGIYIYRLQVGDKHISRKMLLIK